MKKWFVFAFLGLLTVIGAAENSTAILYPVKGKTPVKSFRIFREGGGDAVVSNAGNSLRIQASIPDKVQGKARYAEVRVSLSSKHIASVIAKLKKENMDVCGLDFTVNCRDQKYSKPMNVLLNFGNCKLGRVFPLAAGSSRYRYLPKLNVPDFNWNDLKYIIFYFRKGTPSDVEISEIRLLTRPAAAPRRLSLQRERSAVEILPQGSEFKTFIKRPELKKTDTAPWKLKVGFDDNVLRISSAAGFTRPPRRAIVKNDDRVYQDDAFEFLCSTDLDNKSYYHYILNLNGAIRDEYYGFDPDAVMVRHIMEYSMKHRKKSSFKNGLWQLELEVPHQSIGLDLKKNQVAELQFAHSIDYISYVLGISAMNRNFDVFSYTLAVFNKTPFGRGSLKFAGAEISGSGNAAAMRVALQAQDIPQGRYALSFIVVLPDNRRIDLAPRKWSIGKAAETVFTLENIPDINGVYTIYAIIRNQAGMVQCASVDAVNLKPVEYRFGKHDFQPQVKHFYPRQGKFFNAGKHNRIIVSPDASERTRKSAGLLKKQLLDFTGSVYEITCDTSSSSARGIKLVKAPQAKVNGKMCKIPAEGYVLDITPEQVTITAGDEPGLYYGGVTLLQMIKMPMKRTADSPVACGTVFDWPDLPVRMAALWHPRSVPGSAEVKEKSSVKYVCDFLETFVAANKLNYFKFRIDKSLMFSHPRFAKYAHKRYFSMAELAEIREFCEERFIRMMGLLPGGGHDALIDVFPEFRDPSWNATADVTHPEYMKTYLGCVDEIIKATGCKIFSPGADEWYFKRRSADLPEKVRGKTRAEIFLEFHLTLHKFLKQRNVRMAVAHDMLIPDKNGRSFDIYKTLEKFPRDTIILVWSPTPNEKRFHDLGFEMWYFGTGSELPGATRKYYSGFTSSLYLFGTELSFRFPGQYKYHSKLFLSADAGWNFKDKKRDMSIPAGLADGRLAGVESMFAESANPAAAATIRSLKLPRGIEINAALNKLLPELYPHKYRNLLLPLDKKSFGNINMQISDCPVQVAPKQKAAQLKVNRRCSSVIFLHTAFETAHYRKSRKPIAGSVKNAWHLGYPVANYQVIYGDGTKAVIPIRLGAHIYWFGYQPKAGSNTFTRYMEILYDNAKRPVFLYQYEWVNPHPEKEIAQIILSHDNPLPFKTLVFAVSVRDVK